MLKETLGFFLIALGAALGRGQLLRQREGG